MVLQQKTKAVSEKSCLWKLKNLLSASVCISSTALGELPQSEEPGERDPTSANSDITTTA